MALLIIPAELKLAIADFLEPRYKFRLASTCRELHRTFGSALARHKRLWQQYSHIDPKSSGHSIQEVANDVALNPELAYYIETLNLPKDSEYVQPADTDATRNLIRHYLSVIQTQRSLWYDFDDWREAWVYIILYSQRSRLLGNFLVATAPNLRVLRFEHDPDSMNTILYNLVSNIGRKNSDLKQAPLLPLRNLKQVEIQCDCWSEEQGRKIDVDEELADWTDCFSMLPSIQNIEARTPNTNLID